MRDNGVQVIIQGTSKNSVKCDFTPLGAGVKVDSDVFSGYQQILKFLDSLNFIVNARNLYCLIIRQSKKLPPAPKGEKLKLILMFLAVMSMMTLSFPLRAQTLDTSRFSFIRYDKNVLSFPGGTEGFAPFYQKIQRHFLKAEG